MKKHVYKLKFLEKIRMFEKNVDQSLRELKQPFGKGGTWDTINVLPT